MKSTLLKSVAFAALIIPNAVNAQSTGSIDFDEGAEAETIVVTGSRTDNGVAGIVTPDTTKAKQVLTGDMINRQAPGQTINDTINLVPGVSFQNNDPFGSAGGKLSIRGFDNTRINQTFDGIPLNDSGNYALYSNQQLDPELIEQVNVNLGSADVDAPTAAASGSTVNYRTMTPTKDFGVKLVGSAGDFNFFRVFGVVNTGEFTPWGTRAFFAASSANNDTVYGNEDMPAFAAIPASGSTPATVARPAIISRTGQIRKQQYNAKIYQPIGSNGDFVAISGHYNQNRNNFFGSVPLRYINGTNNFVPNIFPRTKEERNYGIARCTINGVARPGVVDSANGCGSTFDERFNPSNTGNVRLNSRFTLAEGLVLTIDPSFNYVKANGGGTATGREGTFNAGGTAITGYIGGSPYFGRDLNGDGDTLDTVRVLAPSQTQTRRWVVIAGLRYEMDDSNTFRIFYSFDRARHRQTGETNFLDLDGSASDVFPVNDPLADRNGNVLQKRDRKSIAQLNLIGGQYRGEFGPLTVTVGGAYKMFKRDLTNYCATSSATGFVECFGTNSAGLTAWLAANPTQTVAGVTFATQGPQQRIRKYNKFTPDLGLTFDITPEITLFANYSKGVQVPGTDNLYNAFYFPANTPSANPVPETTDNFDLGYRVRAGRLQAQVSGWYTIYNDRLASSYDPETERNVYRNLGRVDKYGIDASAGWMPIPEFSINVFGSYMKSKIKENVVIGGTEAAPIFAQTAGKRESGAPVFTWGAVVRGTIGPVELGGDIKRTGPRYVNDQNLPLVIGGTQVFGAKAPAYTLVNLNARVNLDWAGLGDKTYFQFNVLNVFDKLYVGGFDGQLANNTAPNVNIGAPRTFIGSVVVGF